MGLFSLGTVWASPRLNTATGTETSGRHFNVESEAKGSDKMRSVRRTESRLPGVFSVGSYMAWTASPYLLLYATNLVANIRPRTRSTSACCTLIAQVRSFSHVCTSLLCTKGAIPSALRLFEKPTSAGDGCKSGPVAATSCATAGPQ